MIKLSRQLFPFSTILDVQEVLIPWVSKFIRGIAKLAFRSMRCVD
jgi:hypothetical protein